MRRPDLSRRTLILGTTAASLVMILIVALVIPTTRGGMVDAWCGLGPCPTQEPQDAEPDGTGRLLRMSPEEAATWGNYIALGDSYSSGDGAGDYAPGTDGDGGCWRSANAYPEHIAENNEFAGELGFFACSGQRGAAMLEAIGSDESQLDRLTEHTSLVTIGIGGNDLGFTSVLRTCMMRVPLLESGNCVGQESDIDKRMDKFEDTFPNLLSEIRDRAPDARVLILGYPRLFPAKPKSMYYTLTTSDQNWLNEVGQRLNEELQDTVEEADSDIVGGDNTGSVEFVNVSSALKGHEVSAEEAWINGVVWRDITDGVTIDRSTFHPNADGQNALSKRLQKQIEEGPERPLYATRATVDNAEPDVLASEFD
ncbi:lysophospholipase L1-like esterase [Lipingzhangella halophila]|uniref:Lysophospholipase L1-like esterase n=1 Tax=Lipingzhangella halophila TaxID=1783352 RepID=A0A7W7RDV4_9ACTN|nr:SGNH/GDSL hydrolase family protein [Lipingzhangella halophila]MBB4930183.1 lysophospholipase L1-like esterase [Lipingzhangella halophila]